MYPCNSKICKIGVFIDKAEIEPIISGGKGVKNSCCNQCSNVECPDYGVCECLHYPQIEGEYMEKVIGNLRASLVNEEE